MVGIAGTFHVAFSMVTAPPPPGVKAVYDSHESAGSPAAASSGSAQSSARILKDCGRRGVCGKLWDGGDIKNS